MLKPPDVPINDKSTTDKMIPRYRLSITFIVDKCLSLMMIVCHFDDE